MGNDTKKTSAMALSSLQNATQATKAWMGSADGRLARIEALVTVCCALVAVLVFLGSWRRRSGGLFVRLLLWGAFTVTYPVVSYTIGAMQSAPFHNELFVVWASLLLLLLGSADSITAFALRDNDQQTRTMINQGLQTVYVMLLLVYYARTLGTKPKVLLFLLWCASVAKLGMRVKAYRRREQRLSTDSKVISDYMAHEHVHGGEDLDLASMKGYKYIVTGEEELGDLTAKPMSEEVTLGERVVTAESVWQCPGRLLSARDDGARKRRDICLSFALFKLLMRRFHKYPMAERDLPRKSQLLVLHGLLSDARDLERAFRVVEAELGFVYDFFYTRYPSPKESLVSDALLSFTIVASLATLFFSTLLSYRAPDGDENILVHGFNLDVLITRLVVVLFILLECYQFLVLIFSDWHKVKMICRYVRRPLRQNNPFWENFLKFLCRMMVRKYWKNTINQFCLLDLVTPHPVKLFISWLTLKSLDTYMMTREVQLSPEVKQALLRTLKDTNCVLTNGRLAWHRFASHQNGMSERASVVFHHILGLHTHEKIVVFHMATTLCDLELARPQPGIDMEVLRREIKDDYEVATKLSGYCAYLLAFNPGMLRKDKPPGEPVLDMFKETAGEYLKGFESDDSRYEKMMKLKNRYYGNVNGFYWGTSLGVYFIEGITDAKLRWKLLAELWTELMWFATPTSNATIHAEKLATGGELITHLWALLTHAGIFERRRAWLQISTPTEDENP